jgi:hypothetical protein
MTSGISLTSHAFARSMKIEFIAGVMNREKQGNAHGVHQFC